MARPTNPHDPASPEWQLWVNWQSSIALATTCYEDAQALLVKSEKARDKAAAYAAALEKLGHPVTSGKEAA